MNKLISSASPHITSQRTTQKIMRDVLIALLPAGVASVIIFGLRSLLVIGVCVLVCVVSEWAFEKICKKDNTVFDLSAVVTGVLLAYNLPVSIPLWQAAFGSLFAIVVVKQLFGGIGQNFANPAITARIVMLIAFSGTMTSWTFPDGVSSATPLALMSGENLEALPSYTDMLFGLHGGCLGETCIIALLAGGIYLIARKVITWQSSSLPAYVGRPCNRRFLYGYRLRNNPLHKMGQDNFRHRLRTCYGADKILGSFSRGRVVLNIADEYFYTLYFKAYTAETSCGR